MRHEEFEAIQFRFNELDRKLQLILLGWVVSIAAFMVGVHMLTANAALMSVIRQRWRRTIPRSVTRPSVAG